MMLSGDIMLFGRIISPSITLTSHIVALLISLGFATCRAFSMVIDGKPNKLLISELVSYITS